MLEFELRPLRISDIDSFVLHANDTRVSDNLTDAFPNPYTRDHAIALVQRAMAGDDIFLMGIAVDGKIVGAIGLHPQHDIQRLNAELGYWLGFEFWGKGIMSRAIPQMLELGFAKLPINRIFARPFGHNIGSQRVLEKAGFVLESRINGILIKKGVMEDELIYAVRKVVVD